MFQYLCCNDHEELFAVVYIVYFIMQVKRNECVVILSEHIGTFACYAVWLVWCNCLPTWWYVSDLLLQKSAASL